MIDLDKQLKNAVKHFWLTRESQSQKQGSTSGVRDTGSRSAVTGGKHLDGFVDICRRILIDAGLKDIHIYHQKQLELPGYFRAEKKWDLLAIADNQLIALIEFKAQVGPSFGNNFNNRTEEALGNATDLWAAYREGAFKPSARPWLGYVFILEDCLKSRSPVSVKEPHFPTFPEFKDASYLKRYEILLTKLLRERLYDGVGLILTPEKSGKRGDFSCPDIELSFQKFAAGLFAHAVAFAQIQ